VYKGVIFYYSVHDLSILLTGLWLGSE